MRHRLRHSNRARDRTSLLELHVVHTLHSLCRQISSLQCNERSNVQSGKIVACSKCCKMTLHATERWFPALQYSTTTMLPEPISSASDSNPIALCSHSENFLCPATSRMMQGWNPTCLRRLGSCAGSRRPRQSRQITRSSRAMHLACRSAADIMLSSHDDEPWPELCANCMA